MAADCQPWAVNSHPPWGSSGEPAERRAHPLAPPERWGSRSASCRPALPRRVLGSRRPREAPGGRGFLPGSEGGGGGSPVEGGGREPRGFSRAQSPAPTPKAASPPHGLPRTSCLISFGQTFPGGAVLRGGHRGCLPPTERLFGPPALVACGEGADTFSSPSPQIPGTPSSPPGRPSELPPGSGGCEPGRGKVHFSASFRLAQGERRFFLLGC